MNDFIDKNSIVKKIWGKSDTVLFIFAGAAAEFALNKAVDWLYFTGKLPADPVGRLFSTVTYAQKIIFANTDLALKTIDSISQVHRVVENNRGKPIPDWAYRDVLYMLIHYSISSYETLERKLTLEEKQEVVDVFYKVGSRMQLNNLSSKYTKWLIQRENDMSNDLKKTDFTTDLFKQYKKQLGTMRYCILIEAQKLTIPPKVRQLLGFSRTSLLTFVLPLYQFCRYAGLDNAIKKWLLPKEYQAQIEALDIER
ncbi:MAG TPA: oxygenase MpaB family protein [Hanamia sp.]|nr:oxygenase MpaB family protein [Hanamia sp.]